VPDSAGSGDTFTLTLPPQLTALTTSFDLKAPDGSVVATARVVNGVVTFILTDYADSHDSLHGTAFFSVKWDLAHTPTSGPVSLDFTTPGQVFHATVIKTPGIGTVDRTEPRKAGHWVTDGVTTGPDALAWVIDSPSGPFDQATFDDSVGRVRRSTAARWSTSSAPVWMRPATRRCSARCPPARCCRGPAPRPA
jgi:hypothetical protein